MLGDIHGKSSEHRVTRHSESGNKRQIHDAASRNDRLAGLRRGEERREAGTRAQLRRREALGQGKGRQHTGQEERGNDHLRHAVQRTVAAGRSISRKLTLWELAGNARGEYAEALAERRIVVRRVEAQRQEEQKHGDARRDKAQQQL